MKWFGCSACFRTWWFTTAVATATRSQSRSSLDSAVDTREVLEGNPRVSRLVRRVRNATEPRDRDTTRIQPLAERTCPIPTRLPRIDRSATDPISRCVHKIYIFVIIFFLQQEYLAGYSLVENIHCIEESWNRYGNVSQTVAEEQWSTSLREEVCLIRARWLFDWRSMVYRTCAYVFVDSLTKMNPRISGGSGSFVASWLAFDLRSRKSLIRGRYT